MDGNDCFLTIKTFYKNKFFTVTDKDLITLDNLKEKALQIFGFPKYTLNLMEFSLNKNKKIKIINDDDIVLNADDSDEDHPYLELNLTIKIKKII